MLDDINIDGHVFMHINITFDDDDIMYIDSLIPAEDMSRKDGSKTIPNIKTI